MGFSVSYYLFLGLVLTLWSAWRTHKILFDILKVVGWSKNMIEIIDSIRN